MLIELSESHGKGPHDAQLMGSILSHWWRKGQNTTEMIAAMQTAV